VKVVINACFGGFSLSSKATEAYLARKGQRVFWFKQKRDKTGRPDFDAIVPTETPDEEFIAFSYTDPEASEDAYFSDRDIVRTDPDLIAVVEELRGAASGKHAKLEVIDIPDDVEWIVEEYDGLEHIAEAHRVWR
jgi:hypothetical protein